MKLQMLGFVPSKGDTSLFFKDQAVSSLENATSALLHNLEKEFALIDLEKLHYFLGIEVERINGGILLSQNKYAEDLLKKTGMFSCKPVRTPLST
jgi:hypothetical protein